MKASNLTLLWRRALALYCCVTVLLLSTGSPAVSLSCDCAGLNGQDQACCCIPPEVEMPQGGCCQPSPQRWSQVQEGERLNSGCDECGCFDSPTSSDFSRYMDTVPSPAGGKVDHQQEVVLPTPVAPLAPAGKIVTARSESPPSAAGLLGTVVLQL